MKKIISLALVVLMAVSMLAFSACDKKATDEPTTGDSTLAGEVTTVAGETTEELKFGLGIVTTMSEPKDADGDQLGAAEINTTAVAVLLDAEGKIVDLEVDALQAKTAWTSEGKATTDTELKTKGELKEDYKMALHANTTEWYLQAAAFEDTAKGKTAAEVKAFMGEDTMATGDLAAAGCTISVGDFIKALDKAVANAAASKATAADTLQLAFATTVKNTNADEENAKDGSIDVTATIVAAVTDAEGKVIVAKTDAAQANVAFDIEGVLTTDTTKELKTKGELKEEYGMAAAMNTTEWYLQAEAFDSALVGKKAADFAALTGSDDLATAGCTIDISDMVKAATKAATVA